MKKAVSTRFTGNKPGRRSAREWRVLMRAFARSGETRTQFCARHAVALSTFDWWRSRLRRESTPRAVSDPAPADALFVELAPVAEPVAADAARWDVELEFGGGVFLRLRRGAC
jgi:hypothetical protein